MKICNTEIPDEFYRMLKKKYKSTNYDILELYLDYGINLPEEIISKLEIEKKQKAKFLIKRKLIQLSILTMFVAFICFIALSFAFYPMVFYFFLYLVLFFGIGIILLEKMWVLDSLFSLRGAATCVIMDLIPNFGQYLSTIMWKNVMRNFRATTQHATNARPLPKRCAIFTHRVQISCAFIAYLAQNIKFTPVPSCAFIAQCKNRHVVKIGQF